MKRIAVLTSGGDSPGMNACIRAVVRQALAMGMEPLGIRRGFEGLIDGDMAPMSARGVSSVMRFGGTVLQTARSARFHDADAREAAVQALKDRAVGGLVVIGGNGSFRGAVEAAALGMPVMGVPASIDNDVGCTDMAIGVDTCLNTILEAMDKIKDTATSLRRPFIIEVMGRHCGYLALAAGLAGGAELVIVPEHPVTMEDVAEQIERAYERGKHMFMALVSEGASIRAAHIVEYLEQNRPREGGGPRLTILGHLQRGGAPSAFDRILATRLGVAAVEALAAGKTHHVAGLQGREIVTSTLEESLACPPRLNPDFLRMAMTLAE